MHPVTPVLHACGSEQTPHVLHLMRPNEPSSDAGAFTASAVPSQHNPSTCTLLSHSTYLVMPVSAASPIMRSCSCDVLRPPSCCSSVADAWTSAVQRASRERVTAMLMGAWHCVLRGVEWDCRGRTLCTKEGRTMGPLPGQTRQQHVSGSKPVFLQIGRTQNRSIPDAK